NLLELRPGGAQLVEQAPSGEVACWPAADAGIHQQRAAGAAEQEAAEVEAQVALIVQVLGAVLLPRRCRDVRHKLRRRRADPTVGQRHHLYIPRPHRVGHDPLPSVARAAGSGWEPVALPTAYCPLPAIRYA